MAAHGLQRKAFQRKAEALRERRMGLGQVQRGKCQWPRMQSKRGEAGNLMMLRSQS